MSMRVNSRCGLFIGMRELRADVQKRVGETVAGGSPLSKWDIHAIVTLHR
jgi:hypothetical protein